MPVFKVKLDDGRTIRMESDHEPTEQEVFDALGAYEKPEPAFDPKISAPWVFPQEPSSLTPQSDFGIPQSMVPPPIPAYPPGTPTIGPAGFHQQFGSVSDAEMFTPEQLEHLRTVGEIPPASAWEKSMETRVPAPKAPTIDEAYPSEFEQAIAPMAFGAAAPIVGGERASQILRSTYNAGAGLWDFMTSLQGVASIPLGMAAPRAVTGYFAYDMLKSLLDQDEHLQKNWDHMTEGQRIDALTRLGITGAFAGHLSTLSLKAPKFTGDIGRQIGTPRGVESTLQPATLGENYARSFSPTETVHGDVLRGPGEGFEEMPPEIGGAGVRTQATAETLLKTLEERLAEAEMNPEEFQRLKLIRAEILEMGTLRGKRARGEIDELEDLRLQQLEAEHGIEGLSTEDALSVLQSRHELSDVTVGGNNVRVRTTDTATEERKAKERGQPFSPAVKESAFTIDRENNEVIIFTDKLASYRDQFRREGKTDAEIDEIIRSSIFEEVIHLATDPRYGQKYYDAMSALERRLTARRYGFGEDIGLTPEQIGMEALRFRIQRAMGMTPTEFTQMTRAERWKYESLAMLESIIRSLRETFTSAGARGRRAYQKALLNVRLAMQGRGQGFSLAEMIRNREMPGVAAPRKGEGEPKLKYDEWLTKYKDVQKQWMDQIDVVVALNPESVPPLPPELQAHAKYLDTEGFDMPPKMKEELKEHLKKKEALKPKVKPSPEVIEAAEAKRDQLADQMQALEDSHPEWYRLYEQSLMGPRERGEGPGLGPNAPRRPNYKKIPQTRGEALETIEEAFRHVQYLQGNGASKSDIRSEIEKATKYSELIIGVNEMWMEGHEFAEAPKPNPEVVRDMKAFNERLRQNVGKIWEWFEGLDQQSFPAAPRKPDLMQVVDEKEKRKELLSKLPGGFQQFNRQREELLNQGYDWATANKRSGWNDLRADVAKEHPELSPVLAQIDASLTREILAMARTGRGMSPALSFETERGRKFWKDYLNLSITLENRLAQLVHRGLAKETQKEISSVNLPRTFEQGPPPPRTLMSPYASEQARQMLSENWVSKPGELQEAIEISEQLQDMYSKLEAFNVDLPEEGEIGPGTGINAPRKPALQEVVTERRTQRDLIKQLPSTIRTIARRRERFLRLGYNWGFSNNRSGWNAALRRIAKEDPEAKVVMDQIDASVTKEVLAMNRAGGGSPNRDLESRQSHQLSDYFNQQFDELSAKLADLAIKGLPAEDVKEISSVNLPRQFKQVGRPPHDAIMHLMTQEGREAMVHDWHGTQEDLGEALKISERMHQLQNELVAMQEGQPRMGDIGPGLGPNAARRPIGKKEMARAEAREKLRQMREKQAAGEMEPGTEAGALLRQIAFKPVTPQESIELVGKYVESGEPTVWDKDASGNPTKVRVMGGNLSFQGFLDFFRARFGPDVGPGQVRELFGQNVGDALLNAGPERIAEILKGMKIVREVFGGGRPAMGRIEVSKSALAEKMAMSPDLGKRATEQAEKKARAESEAAEKIKATGVTKVTPAPKPIVEPQPRQLLMDILGKGPVEISKALNRALKRKGAPTSKELSQKVKTYHRAVAEILYTLVKQSEGLEQPVSRKTVEAGELANPTLSKSPVYYRIRKSQLSDVDALGEELTSGARVHGAKAANVTRRLVALQDNESGSVHLVDIYKHPKGVLITSPAGVGHQSLESVLKTHTPIYSVLLDSPVKDFRQRFTDIKDYENRFGAEAAERASEMIRETIPMAQERYSPAYRSTTGSSAIPGEFQEGEGLISATGSTIGPMTGVHKFQTGLAPGEIELGRPITKGEADSALDFALDAVGEWESPGAIQRVLDKFEAMAEGEGISGPNIVALAAFNKMFHHIARQKPEWSYGQVVERIGKILYEINRTAETRDDFIRRAVGIFGGEVSEAVPVAARLKIAEAVRGAEAAAQRRALAAAAEHPAAEPLERERTVAPGELPSSGAYRAAGAEDLRQRRVFEEAYQEAAARAVREPVPATAPPKPYDPRVNKAIQREYKKEQVDESYTDRAMKEMTRADMEAIAEAEKFTPREKGESIQKWMERMQESVARLEEYKAARKQGELGSGIGLGAARRHATPITKGFTDLTSKTIGNGIRIGSEWLVDRLRRVAPANARTVHQHLAKANQIISESMGYSGELFSKYGDDLLREAGKLNKGTTWMNDYTVVEPFIAAIQNARDAIEGRIHPPAFAQAITEHAQEVNYRIGQFLEPVSPDFIANGGMANMWTAFGYDVIREGPNSENFKKLVIGNARANPGISVREVRQLFLKLKKILDDPNSDPAALFTINQDFARVLPRSVTHIWTGPRNNKLGHWEPVIHSDLFNYFNHGIRRAAMIKAFREVYPYRDPTVAQQPSFTQVIDQMRKEMPGQWHPLINTLYRVLQGHPSENLVQTELINPRFTPVRVTTPVTTAARALSAIGQTFKSAWLTQQVLLQPPELLFGGSGIFFGFRRSWLRTIRHLELRDLMEYNGGLDKILYNNAWNASSPVRSAFRIFNNNARRWTAQALFNEMQEAQGAGAAYITATRLINASLGGQRLNWHERNILPQAFRAMGFTRPEVAHMMAGDPVLLVQMYRKAASFASGGHAHPGEQGRFLANRAVQSLLWFQKYPATRANQFMKIWEGIVENHNEGRTKETAAGVALLARFMAGTTAQGFLQTMIFAAFYGGPIALALKWQDMKDEPFAFFFDIWRSAVSGPFQLVTRGWQDSGLHGVANGAKRMIAPLNIAGEVYDVGTGKGSYTDMDLSTRISRYLQKQVPMSKAVKLAMAATGLSQDDIALEQSMTALNTWKRKKYGFEEDESYWKIDESKAFRTQMKKAVAALKDGDLEGFLQARLESFGKVPPGTDGLAAVRSSLLSRRVLTNPRTHEKLDLDEIDELINRIGPEAYDKLFGFDLMLEALAEQ